MGNSRPVATYRPAGESHDSQQLAELRKFLTCIEARLPQAVAIMYSRLLEAIPEAAGLFKGNVQEQQQQYLHMLREIVKAHPFEPSVAGSGLHRDLIDPRHRQAWKLSLCLGVKREHFDKMKTMLVHCFYEYCPEHFSADAEAALGFIFDVLAKGLNGTCGIAPEVWAHKNKLPHQHKTVEPGNFVTFLARQWDEAL